MRIAGARWKGLPTLFLWLGFLAGCSVSTVPPSISNSDGAIAPLTAIQLAANAEGRPVPGTFRIHVQATGRQDGNIYLNSERDYRDQRNLTIAILPSAITVLQRKFGQDPDKYFQNKEILVLGTARRVKIFFLSDGKPTDKYYYQTHVTVTASDQITVSSR